MFTTTVVGDDTVVVLTTIPAPLKVTRVALAVRCALAEPVSVRFSVDAGAVDALSLANVTTSIDFPVLWSPVVPFFTRNAVVPFGRPPGTLTVSRFWVESMGMTVRAATVTVSPD